jgi:S-disulfanyl-L-cysteine oxidoreductase SoxD
MCPFPPISFKVIVIPLVVVIFSCSKQHKEVANNDQSDLDTLNWPSSFQIGRPATLTEIAAIDIDVRPDGKGLPSGSGTVPLGRKIYAQKCGLCHGKSGVGGPFNPLVTKPGSDIIQRSSERKVRTVGNYWPYATTLYDYINRAMPYTSPGSLTPDEVYSLTAYLLHANGFVDSVAIMNSESLPKVILPARNLFVTDDRKGGHEVK